MWECDFRQMIKENIDLRNFIKNNEHLFVKDVLNPRDAFKGGRVNAVKLYHKCESDEKIYYYDFCSLYPYINKYFTYPIGHPTIYVGDERCRQIPLESIDGLVKCTVLPPQNL